jgi:hypothetical protein
MSLTPFQKASFRFHNHSSDQIRDPETGDPAQVTPAANVALIADPASATAQDAAEKVNAVITALIDAELMEAS